MQKFTAALVPILCVLLRSAPARAQVEADPESSARRATVPVAPLGRLGSDEEDRDRVAQVLGRAPTAGFLLRSTSTRGAPLPSAPGGGLAWGLAPPEVLVTYNSALPFSLNDGAMWAGRGVNASAVGGVQARRGRVRAVVAPTVLFSQNRAFSLPTDPRAAPPIPAPRSPYGYPWRVYRNSIDYPLRFGPEAFTSVDFGESGVFVDGGPVEYGVTSEHLWWGPGLRNALIMSDNAPGFGHAFVRTARPLRTRAGDVEARFLLGGLSESSYFADGTERRHRSLSALAATIQPAFDRRLTLGAARAVFAPLVERAEIPRHVFDVLSSVGRPNAYPMGDPRQSPGRDQLFSLFARYVLPEAGLESYLEWGRAEMPTNLRDALVAPNHTQAYTLGLQWARPVSVGAVARLQAEYTALNQSSTYRVRPTGSWYTSRAVIQGYTQRGQPLGAAIGPGATGQWLAGDYLAARWGAGAFAGRIRWDDDSYYEIPRPNGGGFCKHDVSLLVGTRGSYRTRAGVAGLSLTWANRLNTFYQNFGECPNNADRVDTRNATLSITLSPASAR